MSKHKKSTYGKNPFVGNIQERKRAHIRGCQGQEWGLSTSGAGCPFGEMELDSGDACTAS